MQALLPKTEGQLLIYSNSRDARGTAVSWPNKATTHLYADDCWVLRRGRAYAYGSASLDLPCAHHKDTDQPSFCLPIIAHGDTIGLLSLSFPYLSIASLGPDDVKSSLITQWELGLICAEQISLASQTCAFVKSCKINPSAISLPVCGIVAGSRTWRLRK